MLYLVRLRWRIPEGPHRGAPSLVVIDIPERVELMLSTRDGKCSGTSGPDLPIKSVFSKNHRGVHLGASHVPARLAVGESCQDVVVVIVD